MQNLKNSFLSPRSEFSPLPFWFWNDNVNETEIKRQIKDFKDKGIDGFVIHPRIGMNKKIEYMSAVFMKLVETAVKTAAHFDMKVILYDEGMYPSGSAHGQVVKSNPDFASKGIIIVDDACGRKVIAETSKKKKIVQDYTNGRIRGIHYGEDSFEHNAPKSSDLLNVKAVEKFIELTHDKYFNCLKEFFGDVIIGFFTDEPSITGICTQKYFPWTDDFLYDYLAEGCQVNELEFLWEDGHKEFKNNYNNAVLKRFINTYYKPLSKWCEEHNVALMGHPAKSTDMELEKYFHIPGQDLVWRYVEPDSESAIKGEHSTMAKCSSDLARHLGKRRNSNECFGACNKDNIDWNLSADDIKWYIDWLALRGVNMFIPHAFYYSIKGKRKYERPPDVGPNNIWWKHYRIFSDYIKRLSYIMTDGVNQTDVAVLCSDDELPHTEISALWENQIEFNYLQASLLENCKTDGGKLHIKNQSYGQILILDEKVITMQGMLIINEFQNNGGKIIHDVNSLYGDIALDKKHKDLRVSHILKNGIDLFVFVNEGEDEIKVKFKPNDIGYAEQWDALIGTCILKSYNEYMTLDINLQRRESTIIAVDITRQPVVEIKKNNIEYKTINFNNGWTLNGKPLDKLKSWTKINGMKNFQGECIYENCINLNHRKVILDLGLVGEIAEVYVNDKIVGVRMWRPYVFDISTFITQGENKIKIKVVNSMVNKYTKTKIDSGIIGDIVLLVSEEK